MLIEQFRSLLERGWRGAFPGTRSQQRAIQHAIALPCVFGRRTRLAHARCFGPMEPGLERRLQDVLAVSVGAGAVVRSGAR